MSMVMIMGMRSKTDLLLHPFLKDERKLTTHYFQKSSRVNIQQVPKSRYFYEIPKKPLLASSLTVSETLCFYVPSKFTYEYGSE